MFIDVLAKTYYCKGGPADRYPEYFKEVTPHMVYTLAATMEHVARTWLVGPRRFNVNRKPSWDPLSVTDAQTSY
jgi:hypothetical protein